MDETNRSAWATGECPYGFTCEDSSNCPAIEFKIPESLGGTAELQGFDVSYGFSPASRNRLAHAYAVINVCVQALEDPLRFEQTTELEKHKLSERL